MCIKLDAGSFVEEEITSCSPMRSVKSSVLTGVLRIMKVMVPVSVSHKCPLRLYGRENPFIFFFFLISENGLVTELT